MRRLSRIATDRKLTVAGDLIKKARLSKHMSREELARKMQLYGLNTLRESIFRMERGERIISLEEASAIHEILEIDGNQLMDYVLDLLIQYSLSASSGDEK